MLLSGGCAERFLDFQVQRLVGLRVTQIDGAGFQMQVRCELQNPNPLGATVDEVDYRVRLGQHPLGRGRLPGPIAVGARGRFTLEVPVRVNYADLPADFPEQVKDGVIRLVSEAALRARTGLGTYRMLLTSTGTTRVDETISVLVQGTFRGEALRVESIGLAGLELRQIRLRLRLRTRNLFAFPVEIQRGEFRLDVNDRFFGESRLEQPLRLPPRGSVPTEVQITATHGTVASMVTSMLGQEPRFRVRGTLWIAPLAGVSRIPIDVKADSSVFTH